MSLDSRREDIRLHDLEKERIEMFVMRSDIAHNNINNVQSESVLFCILKNKVCDNLFEGMQMKNV
jgi:hypothetical protein